MNFWNPTNLNQIVGNEEALELLRSLIQFSDQAPRAYLFDGPSGCGKNTIAKLFLAELLPGKRSITISSDRFAQILKQEDFSEYECIIWDHADKLTRDQSDEIASLMDRSKSTQVFAFIASGRLEQSIRSRTLRVTCSKLSDSELSGLLGSVCASNDITFSIEALDIITAKAAGVPSCGLSMLQAASVTGKLTLETALTVSSDLEEQCRELLRLINQDQDSMPLIGRIRKRYELTEVVDTLFDIYSIAYVNKDTELLQKLSNYRKIGEIFLKWKSAHQVPSSALYLLVRELMDSNTPEPQVTMTVEKKSAPIQRSRELTYSEMVALIEEGCKTGD